MEIGRFYKGRRVMVTGHTGFKGSWLSEWLCRMGAEVAGFSNGIPTDPSHFDILGLDRRMLHRTGDIRNRKALVDMVESFKPEILFHLAAQPLVRRSYQDPHETFETNVMGTVNVLEAIRETRCVQAAVIITSDKCYHNDEWPWGYRENDRLGGEDPYSASKGCAELVIHSYVKSYFQEGPAIASTRAGNVIGGGDWADDRIIPDAARAWSGGDPVIIRNPGATRPWQHVLEPLGGYLWLGRCLYDGLQGTGGEAFNFGPDARVNYPVQTLLESMAEHWKSEDCRIETVADHEAHESTLLKLSCDKALHVLKWFPVLQIEETVAMTANWYRVFYQLGPEEAAMETMRQIDLYTRKAVERGAPWRH